MSNTETFMVCLLDDNKGDLKTIKQLITPALKELTRDVLKIRANIKIEAYQAQKKLHEDLIKDGNIKQSLKLLILDFYLANNEELDQGWFKTFFPSVPTLILTKADSARFQETVTTRYINKDCLKNPDEFIRDFKAKISGFWESPFWKDLKDYVQQGHQSWHTPGHKFGNSFARSVFIKDFYKEYGKFSFNSDLSVSVGELGDLSEPLQSEDPMTKAMKRSSDVFGSNQTYFITNGTSTSNKILLMTLLKPGDVVLVDRNCHKSVHQAIVMSGALPVYLSPGYNKSLGIWLPLTIEQIENTISEIKSLDPKMIIVTNCTYDGILYPLRELVTICDNHRILLLADEAWFAYGRFHPYYINNDIRYNAMDAGAHFCVQSTHKTLSAFSQASMIHIGDSFSRCFRGEGHWIKEKFKNVENFHHTLIEGMRYFASTSPHYPIIASLDVATTQCLNAGVNILEDKIQLAKDLEAYAGNAVVTKNDIVGNQKGFDNYFKDPLKFSLKVKNRKMDNFKGILESKKICWEKSTENSILFLITFGTSKDQVEYLKMSIKEGEDKNYFYGQDFIPEIDDKFVSGQVRMLPIDAHYAEGNFIPFEKASKKIACHMVVPYPPGIPMILPGMKIPDNVVKDILERLREGKESVHGILWIDGEAQIRVLSDEEEKEQLERRPELLEKFSLLEKISGR